MTDLVRIGPGDVSALAELREQVRAWCGEHQCEVGVAEMILGAGILCYGVKTGMIEVGKEVLGLRSTPFDHAAEIGASIGAGTLGVAGAMIGSIGVATSGGAIAVPASILALGGVVVGAALGYSVGDLSEKFFGPHIGMKEILAQASILVVGLVLLVDGARRVLKDQRVRAAGARIRDRVIQLGQVSGQVVLARFEDIDLCKAGTGAGLAAGATASGLMGGVAAHGMAAGGVAFAGSKTLGAIALSVGALTVPAWPVVIGTVFGVGVFALGVTLARTGIGPNLPSDSDEDAAPTPLVP